jgi:regulator of replication initiation timing
MLKDRVCREYIEEIERLERSIIELEEQINELKMQLRLKVDEANSLAIENTSLRHKLDLMRRRERYLIELLKKFGVPFIIVNEDELEDADVKK